MNINIQLTVAGVDVDNFILYYYIPPGPYVQFDTGVSRTTLLAGVNYTIPDGSTEVKIVSTGVCTNELILTIELTTTTSTSTSSTSTSSSTSSSTSTSSTTTTDTTTEGTTSTSTSTSSTSTSTSTSTSSTSTSSTTTSTSSTSSTTSTSSTSTSTSTSTDTTSTSTTGTTTTVIVYSYSVKTGTDTVGICSTEYYTVYSLTFPWGIGMTCYTTEDLGVTVSGTYMVYSAESIDFPIHNLTDGVVGSLTGEYCPTTSTTSTTTTSL